MKTFEQYIEGYFSDKKPNYSDPSNGDLQPISLNMHFGGIKDLELPVIDQQYVKSSVRREWERSVARNAGRPFPGSTEPDPNDKDLIGTIDYKGTPITVRWNPVYKVWQGTT